MAKRSSLFIRIVEGKNLPAKDITGSSDPYCIVKIDNEAIIRTATVWKTLFPFWGEEYEVHLPPSFHCVSFYVMDEDALSRDDVIGKVCITQSLLAEHPKGYNGWLNLTEIDPDKEVQGEIHLRIEIVEGGAVRKLCCTLFDARDLARKDRNGASDPFVRVRYNGKTQETLVIKKSCYPRWNETFEFDLDESAVEKLCIVEVWDWDLVSRNDFLGKVVFNVQRLQTVQREEGWFLLRPDKAKPRRNEGNLGSLHLQVQLRNETVLPSIHYQPLVQLLCQEVKVGAQVAGMQYLHRVLGPTVTRLFEEKRCIELDPSKVESKDVGCSSLHRIQSESDVIQQSAQLLRLYLTDLLAAITKSIKACPAVVRATFQLLFKRVGERFPEERDQNVKFIAITSFLCLRFLSPAIMSPKLFHLREKHADARTSRALLLLAKAVQSVGNMDAGASRTKEAWMEPLQPTIQQGVAQMKQFLLQLIDIEEKEELDLQKALSLQTQVVKEGHLFIHKMKSKGSLISSSFKKLYFSLTSEALSYTKTPNSKKSSSISLASIRAVEKVEEKSFGNSHVMQIVYANDAGQEDTAYLQCKCVNELNQWLSALRKVCVNNAGMLCSYHPGVFRGDKWSCCHQRDKSGLGCDKTRHGVTLREWNDPLDPDLEAQLIFRHLLGVQEVMREKYLELSALEKDENFNLSQNADPQSADAPSRFFQVLQDLEEIHRKECSRLSDLANQDQNRLVELQT
ncbi:ras GTPase-activating protein 4-like isoform X2 [Rhineura floridana]|uniref:ras GTPase-activating protein 4-like isoform X2 n=1 Tax=Rhineura floridana TaxID=261503 RepID=UPI002AC83026|nr:ras GTPase-activating protein 4-like isoform X2 [Rhineura floridana]